MLSAVPKTHKCVVTLYYSPCDDTPTAATVAVTTGGVSLRAFTARKQKRKFFQISKDTAPVIKATVATMGLWEYRQFRQ
jgi:hypothetical protein